MSLSWSLSPTIPCPITVYHQVWTQTGETDDHGNPAAGYAPAVARPVQSINQFGNAEFRTNAREIVDADFTYRTDVLIEIGVPDVTVYNERDLVTIDATGIDDNGNPIGGTAYHVDGPPSDNRQSPFPLLKKLLGGAVVVRRVT